MKKTHKAYLRRIIGTAAALRNREDITDSVAEVKAPDSDLHHMLRDIVCDARFYAVIDNDKFWKDYGTDSISTFIDSINADTWMQEESRTLKKEEFLNNWLASHLLPLTEKEKKDIELNIKLKLLEDVTNGMPDPGDSDGTSIGEINLGNGIKDKTHCGGDTADGLPPQLKEYMKDAPGGNSPGLKNDGHTAEAKFLNGIDPTIKDIAEKIGRRGTGEMLMKGKFRHASKSDISGVTVGDDLNSLLPSELAMLASPTTENIFIERFAGKRLQIFSSASVSRGKGKDKRGPIYLCIDTSGSMTGQPEELAKTLALAISIIAQKEKRTVCIINYSMGLSFFVLNNLRQQRRKLLRFLSESYGGGNDENKLFHFLFQLMPKLERYRAFARDFEGADLLIISDFLWKRISDENSTLINMSRRKGMRFFSIGIGLDDHSGINFNEDKEDEYYSGFQLFGKSDFRYVYEEGQLKEVFNEV